MGEFQADTAQGNRGAHSDLQFRRCAKGFVLEGQTDYGAIKTTYAFADIGSLADWLVAEYGETVHIRNAQIPDCVGSGETIWSPPVDGETVWNEGPSSVGGDRP